MTEHEWLTSAEPAAMLEFLRAAAGINFYHVSDRKLRLFACACCHTVWHLITDERSRRAVEVAELFADGKATKEETFHLASSCTTIARCLMPSWDASEEARMFLETAHMHNSAILPVCVALLRDIIGNPFRPVTLPCEKRKCGRCKGDGDHLGTYPWDCSNCHGTGEVDGDCPWLTDTVVGLVRAAYEERQPDGTIDPDRLAILADALEDAGCPSLIPCETGCKKVNGTYRVNGEICPSCYGSSGGTENPLLMALRDAGQVFRGFWPMDLLLGKN